MTGSQRRWNVFRLKLRDALLMGSGLFLSVAVIDRATSDEFSLAAFYLFPVLLVAWNCGRRWGILFALLSVVAQSGEATLNAHLYSRIAYLYIAYANVFLEYTIVVVLTNMHRFQYA